MPRQTSIQLTKATERQAKDLTAAGFGTFTDIVRIAIDRLHQQEIAHMKPITKLICTNCGKVFDGNHLNLSEVAYPLCRDCEAAGHTQAEMGQRWIADVEARQPLYGARPDYRPIGQRDV